MQDITINKELNEKQLNFINVYLSEQDINKVCKKLNITRPTYYKYLNDELVDKEIYKIRLASIKETTRYLQEHLTICSNELIKIIESDNSTPQVKINAINSVFNNCKKLTEQVDILSKLDAIEQRLSEQEGINGGNV